MKTMKILVGLPGSGKSTFARTLTDSFYLGKWGSINYDSLRWYDDHGNPKDYKFSREAEEEIKKRAVQIALDHLANNCNLIIDNTNLTPSARSFWNSLAESWNVKVEVVEFNTDLDECLRRNALRTGWARVPRPVIERMALFSNRVTWPVDVKVALVDIDGTLADGEHRQKYLSNDYAAAQGGGSVKARKDWKMYFSLLHLDNPIKPVIEWVRCLHDEGYYVCLVSGRGLEQADRTIEWLEKHNVVYDRIFMRNTGDCREDSIVKKEILDQIIPHASVAFAIDDRPRVIRMWRENGIKVYDVGKGIEF